MAKYSIHINPENKGKFTQYAEKNHLNMSEAISKGRHSSSLITRKRAVFAANARKWHHELGGNIPKYDIGGNTDMNDVKAGINTVNTFATNANPSTDNFKGLDGRTVLNDAMAGASLGTAIAPGIGTAIGAGAGAIVGGVTDLIRDNQPKPQPINLYGYRMGGYKYAVGGNNVPLYNNGQDKPGAAYSFYNSSIPDSKVQDYKNWLQKLNIKDVDTNGNGYDYDYKGAYLANQGRASNGHFTDEFKKPNHETFSVESKYADEGNRDRAGSWKGNKYIPSTFRYDLGGNPNAEVEGNEYIQNPDESMKLAVGPSHEEGGIKTNLAKGSFVFPASYKTKVEETNGDKFKLGTLKQSVLKDKKETEIEVALKEQELQRRGTELLQNQPAQGSYAIGGNKRYAVGGNDEPIIDTSSTNDNIQPDAGNSDYANQYRFAQQFQDAQKTGNYSDVDNYDPNSRAVMNNINPTINQIPVNTDIVANQARIPIPNFSVNPNHNESELSVDDNGNLVTKVAQLAPTIYNTAMAFTKPEYTSPHTISTTPAQNVMNLRYNIQPQLNQNNSDMRTMDRNIREETNSSPVVRANQANAYAIRLNADNKAYGEKNNVENNYKITGNQMLDSDNQYNSKALQYADDANARNRAATRNYAAAATTGLSQATTQFKVDQNLSDHDFIALQNIVAQHPELAGKSASFIMSTNAYKNYLKTGRLNAE